VFKSVITYFFAVEVHTAVHKPGNVKLMSLHFIFPFFFPRIPSTYLMLLYLHTSVLKTPKTEQFLQIFCYITQKFYDFYVQNASRWGTERVFKSICLFWAQNF